MQWQYHREYGGNRKATGDRIVVCKAKRVDKRCLDELE
jgi:hypothetical protein